MSEIYDKKDISVVEDDPKVGTVYRSGGDIHTYGVATQHGRNEVPSEGQFFLLFEVVPALDPELDYWYPIFIPLGGLDSGPPQSSPAEEYLLAAIPHHFTKATAEQVAVLRSRIPA